MDIKSIKTRIEQLCKQRHWSYYKLSKESGFQQSTLKSILKEKNMPSLYTLYKICEAFNISLSDFFNDKLFDSNTKSKQLFVQLWDELQPDDQKKVLIYMQGLLHKQIQEEEL